MCIVDRNEAKAQKQCDVALIIICVVDGVSTNKSIKIERMTSKVKQTKQNRIYDVTFKCAL